MSNTDASWIGKSTSRFCVDCGREQDNLMVRSIVGDHYVLECICGTLYWNLTKSSTMSLHWFEEVVSATL